MSDGPRQPVGDGVLQVEPTDHCNLSCRMCAPHHQGWDTIHGVPRGYLDVGLWERVVAGLVADDCRFDHLIFQWLGDPSLHPDLARLIEIASRGLAGRVGYLRVDTNAIRLGPKRMDALIGAARGPSDRPPLLVVLTLDAHRPDVYADVKGRDALMRVRRNIRYLVRARAAAGDDCRLNLQLQFVVQPGNAGDAGDFLAYWADLLACQGGAGWHDEVMFKRLSVGGGAAGQSDADALYERTLARAGIVSGRRGGVTVSTWQRRPWQQDDGHPTARDACPGLWLTPVIRHDGHLQMCCADLGGGLDLGSLDGRGFKELWNGVAATRHRLDQLAGRFTGPCASCGGINWYDTTAAMGAAARARAAVLGVGVD